MILNLDWIYIMVKLVYDREMKNPKGPCVILIHATWCGFCKTLMPKFENEIVTSQDFSKELEGLLTLGSIEETEYNNHKRKKIFGKIVSCFLLVIGFRPGIIGTLMPMLLQAST